LSALPADSVFSAHRFARFRAGRVDMRDGLATNWRGGRSGGREQRTSDMDKRVETTTDGPVFTIAMNRPDKRNAVDGPMAAELREAFQAFEADDNLRVAVLWGAGGHFCAGADLAAVADPARRHELDPEGGGAGPMGPSRLALSKPLIAAVGGYAVAGGLELALMADLRVVERGAVFGVFCRRWGVPLIDGGTVRLPRLIGMGRALDLMLTGRPVGAEEAFSMGLANRLVENGEALGAALALAREISAFPQGCMLTDRQSAYRQWDLPLAEALRNEGARGVKMVLSEGLGGAARFTEGAGRHGVFEPG
jgi:enoyl-CoA hydratase